MAPVRFCGGLLPLVLSSLPLPLVLSSFSGTTAALSCSGVGFFTSGDSASSPDFGKTASCGRLNRKSRTISACCSAVTPSGPGTLVHCAGPERKGSPSDGHSASLGRSFVAQNAVIFV